MDSSFHQESSSPALLSNQLFVISASTLMFALFIWGWVCCMRKFYMHLSLLFPPAASFAVFWGLIGSNLEITLSSSRQPRDDNFFQTSKGKCHNFSLAKGRYSRELHWRQTTLKLPFRCCYLRQVKLRRLTVRNSLLLSGNSLSAVGNLYFDSPYSWHCTSEREKEVPLRTGLVVTLQGLT